MSYERKGTTGATAIVTSELGGGNFTFINGTDDPALTIEAAWSYLNTLGGGTLITQGAGETWIIETPIDSQGTNVTWLSDWGLKITCITNLNDHLVNIDHDYTILDGLHIDGNEDNQGANDNNIEAISVSHCKFKNLYLEEATEYGIRVRGQDGNTTNDIEISGCYCVNNNWNGITVEDYEANIRVTNNHVEHSGDVGIAIADGAGNSDILINNNTVTDMDGSEGSAGTHWGIAQEGTTGWTAIVGNTVSNCHRGIVTNSGFASGWLTITGNSVRNCGSNASGGAINDQSTGGYTLIAGNVCEAVFSDAGCIEISNASYKNVVGNTCYSATAGVRGIEIDGAGSHANICDNVIEVPGEGVYIDATSDDVNVKGNKFGSCAIGLYIGANADRTVVDGNDFNSCTVDVQNDSADWSNFGGNKNEDGVWIEGATSDNPLA